MSEPAHWKRAQIRSIAVETTNKDHGFYIETETVTHLVIRGDHGLDPSKPIYIGQEQP